MSLNCRKCCAMVIVVFSGVLANDVSAGQSEPPPQEAADSQASESEARLRRLLGQNPRNVLHLYELAKAQRRLGKTAEVLATIDQLLEVEPGNEPGMILLAELLAERQDWSAVVRLLRPLGPSSESYHVSHRLAEAYHQLDEQVEAAWYYAKAVRLNPMAVDDYIELARLHLGRGLPALAVRVLETALKQTGAGPRLHALLAEAYNEAGRPVGRIEIAPLARAIPGQIHADWFVLDRIEDEESSYRVCPSDSAIYHLHKAYQLGLNDASMQLLEADIWLNARLFGRARDIYELIEAIVLPEDLPGYHYRFGQALFGLNDLEGFQQHLHAAAQLDPQAYKPKLLEADIMLADRYCIQGNLAGYVQHLESAVRQSPRSVELRYKLGNALLEADRRGEAGAHLQVVLQLDPFHSDRERLLRLLNYQDLALPQPAELRPDGPKQQSKSDG